MATNGSSDITRDQFGPDFIFGCAAAAYQVEGAYNVGGKSLSNWDTYTLTQPDKIVDGDNGCVAIDHYHRYKDDILMMKKLGFKSYRFSIAWSRILPGGKLNAGVSKEGVQFYNDLIDFLIAQEMIPFVTLFHWDFPDVLQKEYGGFLSDQIIQDFKDLAEVCFYEFGDRVQHWITLNEPFSYTIAAYTVGTFPPNHGSAPNPFTLSHNTTRSLSSSAGRLQRTPTMRFGPPATSGRVQRSVRSLGDSKEDDSRDPYMVAHRLISAHAKVGWLYKTKYQPSQGGVIGMTNMSYWYYPYDQSNADDVEAAKRAVDFCWGWFVEPMITGDYPKRMRDNISDNRLPTFDQDMQTMLKNSYDFLGMNYYTANYAANSPDQPGPTTYYTDQKVAFSVIDVDGNLIGEAGAAGWEYNVPDGIYKLLSHTKTTYGDKVIYITENGWSTKNEKTHTVSEGLDDKMRIKYHVEHLGQVLKAMNEVRVKVKGYFAWSIFDNFEWLSGYSTRFGLVYIDYHNDYARYPKSSAKWFMNFLKAKPVGNRRQAEEQKEEPDVVVPAKRTRNR